MSFEFKRDHPVDHDVRRIAGEIVRDAVAGLSKGASEKAVHAARKGFKKARALLRVVRHSIGRKAFDRGNRSFRDAGRALSAARDAAVLVKAVDALVEHFGVPAASLAGVRRRLVARRREAAKGATHARQAVATLRALGRQMRDLKVKGEGWDVIAGGIERIYRQGRRAMRDARHEPTFESLHEWRKRVKDLWHASQLLEGMWAEELKPFGDQLHHLADLLGDDHDLAVLRQTVSDDAGAFGDAVARVVELVDARREALEREAFELGERLYAEKPKALVKRWRGYWHAWREVEAGEQIVRSGH